MALNRTCHRAIGLDSHAQLDTATGLPAHGVRRRLRCRRQQVPPLNPVVRRRPFGEAARQRLPRSNFKLAAVGHIEILGLAVHPVCVDRVRRRRHVAIEAQGRLEIVDESRLPGHRREHPAECVSGVRNPSRWIPGDYLSRGNREAAVIDIDALGAKAGRELQVGPD